MPKIEVKKKKIEINVGAGNVYPALTDLEVIPSGERQEFNHEGSYGYDNVVVRAVESEQLNVKPSKEIQSFNGLYNKIEVEAVTNEIDSNIVAENIKDGVEILGVEGNFVGQKYAPRKISFSGYSGTDLDYELANLDTSRLTTMNNLFHNCAQLKNIDLSGFDSSNVTDMSYMFNNTTKIEALDLSPLNTSKVTKMSNMFQSCASNNINFKLEFPRSFDTSNVTNMDTMFRSCYVQKLEFPYFNTSKTLNMSYMFASCRYLTELDVSSFDTSSVTNMGYMFQECQRITKIDLKNFNGTKLTTASYMFNQCPVLEEIDLSGLNTPVLSNMSYMFANCPMLKKIDIRNMTFDTVRSYANIFNNVPYDCLIIVKSDTERDWITSKWANYTNIKTVAELGDE